MRNKKIYQSIQYKIAKAASKKLVKKDRLNQVEKEIDNISTLRPHKQYYAALKKLKSTPKNISWGIQDIDGEIPTDKQKILENGLYSTKSFTKMNLVMS